MCDMCDTFLPRTVSPTPTHTPTTHLPSPHPVRHSCHHTSSGPRSFQEDLKFKVTEAEAETIMGMRDSGDSKGETPGEKVAMYTIEVHSKSSGTTIGSSKHRYSEFSGEDVTTMHRLCPPNQRSYSPSYPSYPSYYSSRSLRHSEVYVRQLPLGKEHSPPLQNH